MTQDPGQMKNQGAHAVGEPEKTGVPWWVWLLTALLIGALLLWLLFALMGDDDERENVNAAPTVTASAVPPATPAPSAPAPTEPTDTPTGPTGTPAPGGPITSLDVLLNPTDAAALAGRPVNITGAPVLDVTGDATFFVGQGPDQRVFVFLDEVRAPGTVVEGRVNVQAGQQVAITGEVRTLPPNAERRQRFGLTDEQGPLLENEEIYIYAQKVEIAQRP